MKEKANCCIGDPTRTIKMILWENFTNTVQDEKTYTFFNVRVLKGFKSQMMSTS